MKLIVKVFPEITIKSRPVRKRFIRQLGKNIRNVLKDLDPELAVDGVWDNLEVVTRVEDEKVQREMIERLTCTPAGSSTTTVGLPSRCSTLSRLFNALFARGVFLLVTSNYAPEGLLPNPLYHERFLPVIRLINSAMQVLEVGGDTDFRSLPGLVPLFPTFALIAHYIVGKGRSIADLKTTILFGMWSIIPYFVYLATLYVLVDRLRLEASLALATVAWLMAATVLVTLWVRMH